VIWHDGMVTPHPPVARGLKEVVDAITKAGHEVIDWEPIDHPQGTSLLARMFLADGGESIRRVVEATGEPWYTDMKDYEQATYGHLSTYEMWQLHLERTAFAKKYLDRWNASVERTSTGRPIDGIILPVTPFAASLKGKYKHVGYTGVWNILDYPAATFPVTRADASVDVKDPDYKPVSELDKDIWEGYDAEKYHGGPVSIQVVGPRLNDEKVLEMVDVITKSLSK